MLWCIIRCFFWWASEAIGWVFFLLIIAICIQGLISVLAIYWFIFNTFWFALFLMFKSSMFFCYVLIAGQFILKKMYHYNLTFYWKNLLLWANPGKSGWEGTQNFHFRCWWYKKNSHHFVACFVKLLFQLDSLIFQLIVLHWYQFLLTSLIIS